MLTPIQERLLIMLKWFHNYCQEIGVSYYVVGGSMIGAARHQGFIPWDDDIDVALPRPDYERLLSSFHGKKDNYILESPYNSSKDYLYTYAKLYDTTTTLVENTKDKCKRGLYIDVFPLDGVGNTQNEIDKNFRKVDLVNMFLMTRVCAISKRRSIYKNIAIIIARLIPYCLLDNKKLSLYVDKLASSFGYENCDYVANLMGAYRKKEIMPKEYFGNPKLYTFEDTVVYGVEKCDKFLTQIYGDWRAIPPEDKRGGAHEYYFVDLNHSYLD